MTKRLIVNADDYGHTAGIAEGIRQAHLHGIVTSTSAMMNRPRTTEELKTATNLCPRLGVGVHLVLTTGKPLLPADKVASLVNGDGLFLKLDPFVQHISLLNLDEVWAEWNAQVETFVKCMGHNPDHLDSHHHSSYFTPGLFTLMMRLADQLHCPIRKPFGDDSADAANYLPPELVEQALEGNKTSSKENLPKTTDGFIGDFYDEGANLGHLLALLENMAVDPIHESFELMCHPAVVDDELRTTSDYNDKRADELVILQNQSIRQKLKELHIELITYANL